MGCQGHVTAACTNPDETQKSPQKRATGVSCCCSILQALPNTELQEKKQGEGAEKTRRTRTPTITHHLWGLIEASGSH